MLYFLLYTLSFLLAILGIVVLCISFVLYYHRTRDKDLWKRFWLEEELLTRTEYLLNRGGLSMTILGAILMLVFAIPNL